MSPPSFPNLQERNLLISWMLGEIVLQRLILLLHLFRFKYGCVQLACPGWPQCAHIWVSPWHHQNRTPTSPSNTPLHLGIADRNYFHFVHHIRRFTKILKIIILKIKLQCSINLQDRVDTKNANFYLKKYLLTAHKVPVLRLKMCFTLPESAPLNYKQNGGH